MGSHVVLEKLERWKDREIEREREREREREIERNKLYEPRMLIPFGIF